ncbi:hypothetical protein VK792_09645 [Mesobacterium sp. TK19101]|uniref:Uncharacterized protein n=1 Tax=Mesobacterium hydrothermale TaxID=3111907 RepID=A0ABU6HI10_9RHOB|nr:hypothetical protein [Mesobacterium sp. TK19101]MEC3861546.1 hypothetical protein [Mesobacterium sp. TK19101]
MGLVLRVYAGHAGFQRGKTRSARAGQGAAVAGSYKIDIQVPEHRLVDVQQKQALAHWQVALVRPTEHCAIRAKINVIVRKSRGIDVDFDPINELPVEDDVISSPTGGEHEGIRTFVSPNPVARRISGQPGRCASADGPDQTPDRDQLVKLANSVGSFSGSRST